MGLKCRNRHIRPIFFYLEQLKLIDFNRFSYFIFTHSFPLSLALDILKICETFIFEEFVDAT